MLLCCSAVSVLYRNEAGSPPFLLLHYLRFFSLLLSFIGLTNFFFKLIYSYFDRYASASHEREREREKREREGSGLVWKWWCSLPLVRLG